MGPSEHTLQVYDHPASLKRCSKIGWCLYHVPACHHSSTPLASPLFLSSAPRNDPLV